MHPPDSPKAQNPHSTSLPSVRRPFPSPAPAPAAGAHCGLSPTWSTGCRLAVLSSQTWPTEPPPLPTNHLGNPFQHLYLVLSCFVPLLPFVDPNLRRGVSVPTTTVHLHQDYYILDPVCRCGPPFPRSTALCPLSTPNPPTRVTSSLSHPSCLEPPVISNAVYIQCTCTCTNRRTQAHTLSDTRNTQAQPRRHRGE